MYSLVVRVSALTAMPTGEHDHAVHEGDPHCRELEQVCQAAGSRAHPFLLLVPVLLNGVERLSVGLS